MALLAYAMPIFVLEFVVAAYGTGGPYVRFHVRENPVDVLYQAFLAGDLVVIDPYWAGTLGVGHDAYRVQFREGLDERLLFVGRAYDGHFGFPFQGP